MAFALPPVPPLPLPWRLPLARTIGMFLTGSILFLLLSVYREHLIPRSADEARRAVLLTGDEPTYLLMAQAMARGDGMNVRPAHEAGSWRAFQQRPVLGHDQWTWGHYYRGWLKPVTDRAQAWGRAQKPPFSPLLPALLAPLINHTDSIRWWNALLQGLLLCATAMAMVAGDGAEGNGRRWLMGFAAVAGLGSIPVAYYTAQVFPEILAAAGLLGFLMLRSAESPWKGAVAAALLCASLWATPRVAPAVAVASGFVFLDLLRHRRWPPALVVVLGLSTFALFNLHVWSSWFPPMGGSFLTHFLGDVCSREFARRVYLGGARFFWANDIGLIFFSPIMVAGCVALLLNLLVLRSRTDVLVACMVAASVLTIGLYEDYRAGTCPAGRYQVVVACLLVYALVSACRRLPAPVLRRLTPATILFGLLSLVIGLVVAQRANYWFRSYHPLFGYPVIQPHYKWLPSFATGIPNRCMFVWALIVAMPFALYDLGVLSATHVRRRWRRRPAPG